MRFTQGRRRTPPSVIIVSLIDVLLVVLIFPMVTMTFRQSPAVKLVLPESRQAEKGGSSTDRVVVTVAKAEPHLYLGTRPVTFERLQEELVAMAARNSNLVLTIAPDQDAPVQQLVRVLNAAHAARLRVADLSVRSPGIP